MPTPGTPSGPSPRSRWRGPSQRERAASAAAGSGSTWPGRWRPISSTTRSSGRGRRYSTHVTWVAAPQHLPGLTFLSEVLSLLRVELLLAVLLDVLDHRLRHLQFGVGVAGVGIVRVGADREILLGLPL